MKRLLAIMFAFLMAIGFVGCAEYKYADSTNGTNGGTNATTPDDTSTDNSGSGNINDDNASGSDTTVTPEPTEEGVYSVTLYYNNEVFVTSEKIFAYWNNGQSISKAQFNGGVAKITGLDGDYKVTLSAIPKGYTYDSNIYSASAYDKDIAITLYKLLSLTGNGTSFDDCYKISRTGAYRVTISSPNQFAYFKYEPSTDGYYSIASMLDITANEVNPILHYYSSANSGGYVNEYSKQVIDEGGVSNTFTKNFYLEIYEATGTEATIAFCITAEGTTDAAFPIDVDFMLTRTGDYGDSQYWETVVYPTFDLEGFYNSELGQELLNPKGTFKYAAQIDSSLPNTLQSKYFEYNPEDGFYHVYDKEKYADNNGFGPVLYAKLTQDPEIYVTGTDSVYSGDGTVRAKANQMFLNIGAFGGLYNLNGKNYSNFFFQTKGDLPISVIKLNSSGEETGLYMYQTAGYATPAVVDEYGQSDISNPTYKYLTKDGAFPVTEELKQFLQDFAIAQLMFRDGFGDAETGKTSGYKTNASGAIMKYASDEESQWLFACGYYG